ncbi:MAG: T9SS type A sorting domain-containing protein [Bacteroidales bacterium]|nr:T9SS type A sorting domain-containing protein [Bacteroidales bacterium]
MHCRLLNTVIFLIISLFWTIAQDTDKEVPIGWAVVPGNGVESTTGGGNGNVVTVTSASQLASYASNTQPFIILVEGTISGSGTIDIASNKTILGKGSGSTLTGVGLNMNGVSNIIIRNLTISGVSADAIATRGTHHVWIDHCDVSNCGDGLIDITKQSDFHTVSWTRFSNHHKTMLINSGTSQPEDIGTLNTTLHHNWWDGSDTRNPRAGYGKVHVLNCQYNNNDYGIGLHSQCRVLAESNYFDQVNNPIQQMYVDDPTSEHHGFCESVNNIFVSCTGEKDDEGISFLVDDYYMYNFALDAAVDVPSIVKASAGPGVQFSKLGLMPIPGNGAVKVVTSPTLRWTKGQSASEYIVSFGVTTPPPAADTLSEQTYNPGPLNQGTVYYWCVDQITPGDTVKGKVWMFRTEGPVPGRPFVTITSPLNDTIIPSTSKITLEAEAWDSNGTVTCVEFFEGYTSLGIDSSAPYSISWNEIKIGTHVIKAKVTDDERNITFSEELTFTFQDVIPSVSVTSPVYGASFTAPANITIEAEASDIDGMVTVVEFFNGLASLGIDDSFPYSVTWNNVTAGKYYIKAKVADNEGNSSTSTTILITVLEGETAIVNRDAGNIMLYPNPVSDELMMNLNSTGITDLSICNSIGAVVMEKTISGSEHILDLKTLPNGIYYIILTNIQGNIVRKIIKD